MSALPRSAGMVTEECEGSVGASSVGQGRAGVLPAGREVAFILLKFRGGSCSPGQFV